MSLFKKGTYKQKNTHTNTLSHSPYNLFFIRWWYSGPPSHFNLLFWMVSNLEFILLFLCFIYGGVRGENPTSLRAQKSPHPNYKAKMLIYCIHINVKYV